MFIVYSFDGNRRGRIVKILREGVPNFGSHTKEIQHPSKVHLLKFGDIKQASTS